MTRQRYCSACERWVSPQDVGGTSVCPDCGADLKAVGEKSNPYAAPASNEGESPEGEGRRSPVPGTLIGKFEAAFKIFLADIRIFAPLVLFINLPASLLINYYQASNPGRDTDASLVTLSIVVSILFGPIPVGGMIYALSRRMSGEPVSFVDALSQGMNHWIPLLIPQTAKLAVIILGMIPLIVPGLYFAVRLAVLEPVVVLERSRVPYLRSNELVRGKGWEILSAIMLFALGFLVLTLGLAAIPETASVPLNVAIGCARDCILALTASVNGVIMFLYYWEAIQVKPAPEEPEAVDE